MGAQQSTIARATNALATNSAKITQPSTGFVPYVPPTSNAPISNSVKKPSAREFLVGSSTSAPTTNSTKEPGVHFTPLSSQSNVLSSNGVSVHSPKTFAYEEAIASVTNRKADIFDRLIASNNAAQINALRTKAEGGDATAQFDLGHKYAAGVGVAQDYEEAAKWYRKAAEQGDAFAQNNLGVCYADGNGVAKDEAEAVKWYRNAAQKGLAVAQDNLGKCYAHANGVTQDYVEAVKWFRTGAEQGYAAAQYSLSVCYANGTGVVQDDAEAMRWCRKAADQGDASAQDTLGDFYRFDQGVGQDYAEAVKWYRKAAEQGVADAQDSLGICYRNGLGVTQDYKEAVNWFRKAAGQGMADAQWRLGFCYADGKGVAQDNAEAVKWYRKAAEQGLADAQDSLGSCYAAGTGVTQDYKEAVKWYGKAAAQGDASGQLGLSKCYVNGQGVTEDFVEAYKWINLAAAQNTNFVEVRDSLRKLLSPDQIAEAQRLAREFKPRKAPEAAASISREGVLDSSPTASGTGFFITEDGFLISNAHVVKDADKIRLLTTAGLVAAKVVQVDVANDLALLKADGHFSALPIASSRMVKMGNTVATVGFPNAGMQGFAPKLTKGEIASLTGAQDDPRYFQISVPLQPGNSGGALVNEQGNVVGVVSAKLDAAIALAASGSLPENVNYAVKSGFLLSFLESVPELSSKLKEAGNMDLKFEDAVKSAEKAAVLILVY